MRNFFVYIGLVLATCALTLAFLFLWKVSTEGKGRALARLLSSQAGQTNSQASNVLYPPDDVQPIVPSEIVASVGLNTSLYFDGLVLAHDPDDYRFEIQDNQLKGVIERRRWKLTPQQNQIGSHKIKLSISDWDKKVLATKEISVKVVAPKPIERDLHLLIVGDSTIHQSLMPNELWLLLDRLGPGKIHFVGTHHPKPDLEVYREPLPEVFHEGYGGWGWQLFSTHYMPGQEALYKIARSPFVFLENGKPQLNVGRYLDERGVRDRLDAVIFEMGLNETFSADPADASNLEATITQALDAAEKLLSAFREAAPSAKILVIIPPPFTKSEPVFRRVYSKIRKDYGDPWRHRIIAQTFARRFIERFETSKLRINFVPMNAMFDVVDGYWPNDAGHPNELGARQTAEAVFSVLLDALSKN